MKAMLQLCIATVATITLTAHQAFAAEQYPFVLYAAPHSNSHPEEIREPVKFDAVLAKYKQFVGDATNVVVIVKEGLTSKVLASNAHQFAYLGSKLAENSFTYTDVEGGFDTSAYEGSIHAHETYTLDKLADLDSVTDKIKGDLRSTNALFKITLLTVTQNVPISALDNIVEKIEKQAEAVDTKAVFVLAGKPSSEQQIHAINLQQVDEEPIVTDDSEDINISNLKDDPIPPVPVLFGGARYLFPNALIGLLFAGLLIFFALSGYLMLMSVQTPYFYPSESIDFGKIEK